ncbi:MAG: hypothetical protein JNJ59_00330 [Deltaproteobacteria bacterium]|nr:hypothetical protein [Deltaproteobacteria bacterium]
MTETQPRPSTTPAAVSRASIQRHLRSAGTVLVALFALAACGDDGTPSSTTDTTSSEPQPLGAACRTDGDCISRVCLKSQYGTPFCSRACTNAWEPCPAGDDAAAGSALCVSFETLPNPSAPPFEGDLVRFCAPRCQRDTDCSTANANWETCDIPRWLGNPLFPSLGSIKVCQAPSYHGKDPVDPGLCDWEKTVSGQFANEANLCRAYCDYLDRCKELDSSADPKCCEWGCFNRIVIDDTVQPVWRDAIRCYIDTHAAFPDEGPRNACTEPPISCGGAAIDPTPPAAR